MIYEYLKVKNFTSYIEETINFKDFGNIFCLIGENGVGKSSIIDMITTALYFKARGVDNRGSGMDDLINNVSDRFEIEFCFIMEGIKYKIIRKKIRGGEHELKFFADDVDQTEKIEETQKKINKVLKMNYNMFLDTICIGQGESSRFMKKKPNERKEVFMQLIGLKKYEILEKMAKEQKVELKNKIELINDKRSVLSNSINLESEMIEEKENIIKLSNDLTRLIKEKEKSYNEILVEKSNYENTKKLYDSYITNKNSLNNKINLCKNNIETNTKQIDLISCDNSDCEKLENEIEELKNNGEKEKEKINKLNLEKKSLETFISVDNDKYNDLKHKYKRLKDYNESECELCGNSITPSHKEKHLNDLLLDGKKITKQINDKKIEISNINTKIDSIKEIIETIKSEYSIKNRLLNDNKKDMEKKKIIENNLKMYNEQLVVLEKEFLELENKKIEKIEEKSFNDIIIKNEINECNNKSISYKSRIQYLENMIDQINKNKEEIVKLNEELDKVTTSFEDYSDLAVTFSKAGIPADIIGNALPEIEDEINDLLKIICTDNISVAFRTQKESKTKKKNKTKVKQTSIETLDIIISDSNGSRKYETYSGGEKFRIDFACHVGMSKFLVKRAGSSMDFFIIDEGLGSQDDNAKQQFISSIYKLSSLFKQIMIITHIDDIKNAFDNKVIVEKDKINGSKIISRIG